MEDIADPNINVVVISTHGYNDNVSFGIYNTYTLENNYSPELNTKEMEERLNEKDANAVILLGCNMGHADYVGTNVASVIAKLTSGAYVFASDGNGEIKVDPKTGDTWLSSWYNNDFRNQAAAKGSERLNYGWFIYQSGEDGLTDTSLLEYLDRPNENYCLSVTFAEMLSCIPDKE